MNSHGLGCWIWSAVVLAVLSGCSIPASRSRETILDQSLQPHVDRFRAELGARFRSAPLTLHSPEVSLFSAAFGAITNLYVDPVHANALIEVAVATLPSASEDAQPLSTYESVEEAIEAMLGSLDTQSAFLGGDSYADLRGNGERGGIGLELTRRNGVVIVVAPIPGSPAERAGIHGGDRLIEVDGHSTEEMKLLDVVKLLRGPVGSTATVKLERPDIAEALARTVRREIVHLDTVEVHRHSERYAYVRISQFGQQTVQTLVERLDTLRAQGPIEGVVLDLRGNPGGLLSATVRVADLFIDTGMIVATRGRAPTHTQTFNARSDGSDWEMVPIVIVVDRGTAAGSEIVAAALRFHRGSPVLGTPTFGKGTIQTIVPLDDQAAMRLTTSRAVTPSGPLVEPLVPDVSVEISGESAPTIDDAVVTSAFQELSSAAKVQSGGYEPRRKD